jgi:bifunctional non-homologous end joining protein LigD
MNCSRLRSPTDLIDRTAAVASVDPKRAGRIFLDYLRNDRMSTVVAPLSPRGRDGAPVSIPLTWSQVTKRLDPARFTLLTVPALIAKSSAWREYCDAETPLIEAMKLLVARQAKRPMSLRQAA